MVWSCLVSALLTLPFLRLMATLRPAQLLLPWRPKWAGNAGGLLAYGRALAAGELKPGFATDQPSPLVLLFSVAGGCWAKRPTLSSSAVWRLLVLGAFGCWDEGTPLAPAWVQSPGATARCCWWPCSGAWQPASNKLAFKPSGSLAWVALFKPGVGPAAAHPAVVRPGQWQPLNGWNLAASQLASKHCWQFAGLLLVPAV